MGNDVTKMKPDTLSILSNPAVIAINQDPLGSAAFRVWSYPASSSDSAMQGTMELWSGKLNNNDQLVALINGGNVSTTMSASLADIFIDYSTTGDSGLAPEVSQTYAVYDLWANRMSHDVAASIIQGNATYNGTIVDSANSTTMYNSTEMSYKDGIDSMHAALFGAKTMEIEAKGNLTVEIPRHGIGFYRIRCMGSDCVPKSSMKKRKRDEL